MVAITTRLRATPNQLAQTRLNVAPVVHGENRHGGIDGVAC